MPSRLRYWGKKIKEETTVGIVLSNYPFTERIYKEIANNLLCRGGYDYLIEAISKDWSLNRMFQWKKTPEGHTYWWCIHNMYLVYTDQLVTASKEIKEEIQ